MSDSTSRNAKSYWLTVLLTGMSLVALSTTAQAGLISGLINGNDCSGVFGQGFGNCTVGGSPSIVKFEGEDFRLAEINPIFGTVEGSEWDFGASGSIAGTWTYTPGPGDPQIRFVAVKAGPKFNLMYNVPLGSEDCANNILSPHCLAQAVAFDEEVPIAWTTGSRASVSHITFYDSGRDDTNEMPLPATLALLALGGMALVMRRQRGC